MTTRSTERMLRPLAWAGLLALAACTTPTAVATTVNVTLREFSVTPDRASVPRGAVTFHVTNGGTVHHEFLVIKTDLAPDALPRDMVATVRTKALILAWAFDEVHGYIGRLARGGSS